MQRIPILLLSTLFVCAACKKKNFDSVTQGEFTITSVPTDKPNVFRRTFQKYVNVFGIDIYASRKVENADVFHCANIMAEYLDNDEDGVVDNPEVLEEMKRNQAYMFMFKRMSGPKTLKFMISAPNDRLGQTLFSNETRPEGSSSAGFDATLEEVLHLITHAGYSKVYADELGEHKGSGISNAMDLARGGSFDSPPDNYPSGAWYTYDDGTCAYDCMVAEYFYWALTSILGGQDYPGRLEEINNEWDLNTPALVQSGDPAVYDLMTNPKFKLPTRLPDGNYTPNN